MIVQKDIAKMVQHIVRRNNGVADANIMHPMREWSLGLGVVATFVLGGVGLTIFLYETYTAALMTEVPITVTAVPYQAQRVSEAIQYYDAERTLYENLLGGNSIIGKPTATTTPALPVSTTTPITTTDEFPIIPSKLDGVSTTSTSPAVDPVIPPEDDMPATPAW